MVFVGVLTLKRTDLHFLDAAVVKINGQYYLVQRLLPNIKEFSDYFSFQQDLTPANHVNETVDRLKHTTSDFILPSLYTPDLNPIYYKIYAFFSSGFTARKSKTWTCDSVSLRNGNAMNQRITDNTVKQWSRCLGSCVAAKDGHFQYML